MEEKHDFNPIKHEFREPPLSQGLMQPLPLMDLSRFRNMTIEEITTQCREDSQRWFPDTEDGLAFMVLALAGEVGELANLVKKVERGTHTMTQLKEEMGKEAIDVLIYLCNIFYLLDIKPSEVYRAKREFNERRFGGAAPTS